MPASSSGLQASSKTNNGYVSYPWIADHRPVPYEIRAHNDQLLQLERPFLNPLGRGADYTDYKHIIYAPAKGDKYDAAGLPTISDALATGNQIEIDKEIAIAAYFIRGALSILKQFDKFIS
ncbi:unnamed protein product [Rotaria sp. Silwood2]|nr:unnamed protein product [Rotaria sp. Silwood2]CAF4374564.1 unnamed protein product [Rotaria sp. Silwood2]